MDELYVITTYFNPCKFARRRQSYDLFIEGLKKSKIKCLTIQCAFGDDEFELPEALDIIRVRSKTLLWQKERLLNLAAGWLPTSCKYVAWLDCDILFDNANWAKELCNVLRTYPIAQVWETCLRLNKDGIADPTPDITESFAYVMNKTPDTINAGRYDLHGHTGYGWAMRREIFTEIGLYEHAISGSADHFMAHAIYGDYNFCITNALKNDVRQINHLKEWGRKFHSMVQGKLGVVSGQIRHIWHGDAVNRRYFLRMHDITDLGYNPYTDLVISPGKPIEWHSSAKENKQGLAQYFFNYFSSRLEDGVLVES